MPTTPYSLGYVPDTIICQGPEKLLRSLSHVTGAAKLPGGFVTLPASRRAFMIVEALASPAHVSPEYREARGQCMAAQSALLTHVQCSLAGEVRLMPHQWDFLAFARWRDAVLNASEQGTGKTRSAWALWRLWRPKRTVIVCPKSLVNQWADEFYQMWHDQPPIGMQGLGDGPIAKRRGHLRAVLEGATAETWARWPHVTILNYEVLVQLLPELLQLAPEMVVFDECWRIKNPKAAVTKAALKLCAPRPKVALLTGTPVGNDIGDLWSQLKCLGDAVMPDDYWSFMRRYASMHLQKIGPRSVWKADGLADPAGLMEVLEPVWYRATKESCLSLPPKIHRRVEVELAPELRAVYDRVEANGCAELGAPLNLDGEQVTMIRLQQMAGGHLPVPLDDRGAEWRQEPAPCAKIEWLEAFARDQLLGNPSARVLVWCRFLPEVRRVAEVMSDILGLNMVCEVTGSVSNEALASMKASFNSRDPDGIQVLVCQISKMAYGHNLQACDYSIHFSHTWSYVERAQAEDRAHRHGREGDVQYLDLVAKKTIDEQIMRAMERKESLAVRTCPETVAPKEAPA